MFKKANLILLLILLCEFIAVISFGYFINEKVREMTASSMGYESRYVTGIARLVFYNNDLSSEMIEVSKSIDGGNLQKSEKLISNEKWKKLKHQSQVEFSLIRISGTTFLLIISFLGIYLWKNHSNKLVDTKWYHYIFLICSLFFWRESIVSLESLFRGSAVCDEITLWEIIGIRWIYGEPGILLLGLILLVYVIFRLVPREIRLVFMIAGIIGSIVSLVLIARIIGPNLL